MRKLSFGLVALGANLLSERATLQEALCSALISLHNDTDIKIISVSRFWHTPAEPIGSGPNYINSAASILTALPPEVVLQRLHAIEADFGRDRSTGRWSSRVLDLDLIAWGDRIAPDPRMLRHWINLAPDRQMQETPDRLILPHPRMQDRGFVLAPLAEIAPDWRHPLTGRSVVEMLHELGSDALAGMTPFDPAR